MLTDDSIMPFGKYKDKPLRVVPNGYWQFMYDHNKLSGELRDYAMQQVPVLRFLAEKEKDKTKKM